VYRDNDRDTQLGRGPVWTARNTGINIHAADVNPFDMRDNVPRGIGKWSAGCQVFQSSADYRQFWTYIQRSAALYGPRFTYTLIEAA